MEKRQYIDPKTEVRVVNTAQMMKTDSVSGAKPSHPAPFRRDVF